MSNAAAYPNSPALGWRIGLWSVQIALATFYGSAGYMKTAMTPTALAGMGLSYATDIPHALLLFIGTAEIAGAIGIVLPALTRIKPSLTPLAALGFCTIQVLAMGFHIFRGEFYVLPMNLVLLALAGFVLWGRTKKAPIEPRS